jgi:hypothetical protein
MLWYGPDRIFALPEVDRNGVEVNSFWLQPFLEKGWFEPVISRFPTPVFSSDKILITHNYVEVSGTQ